MSAPRGTGRRAAPRLAGRRSESGQLTPLIIGFVVIAVLAVAVMVNASTVFLHRRSLAAWADGAALTAAQSVSERAIYQGDVGDNLPLAAETARTAVAQYAARHGLANRFDEFALVTVEVDPATDAVTVAFASRVPFALADESFGAGVPIRAEATAVAPLR